MKKQYIVILLILISMNLFADNLEDNEEIFEYNSEKRIYNLSGFALELSCFNYFNIGLGYNWGTYSVNYGHFFANSYGFLIEYKSIKELHLRIYYDIYGGSAGMLLGASGIASTDFEKISAGLAPHVGIGFAGMKLFYRYNFYLNKTFNCHEIVLSITKSPNKNNLKNHNN